MSTAAILIAAIVICTLWWGVRALRAPPLMIENDVRLSDLQKIIDNERILQGRGGMRFDEDTSRLHEHPTIKCRWSDHPNHGGPKPAVWQHNMRWPVCKECLHEDPYE